MPGVELASQRLHAHTRIWYNPDEVRLAVEDDTLGEATGGSPYPVRALCKTGCGRRTAKGRKGFCSKCGRTTAGAVAEEHRLLKRQGGRTTGGVGASITPEQWQTLWRSQSGMCPICLHALRNRYDPTPQPGARVAALDHDHVVESDLKKRGVPPSEALRASLCGLLCAYPCNRLLVRHWTAQRLTNAARFRATMPAQQVLRHG